MSKIEAATIRDRVTETETATQYVVQGSAKLWCYFNGTGTIAVVGSINVSSLTDDGTGDYSVNITNSFAAHDYAWSGCGQGANLMADNQGSTVSLIDVTNRYPEGAANSDTAVANVIALGVLA